ncbi:MAG: hypothetical protein ABSG27_04120 [Candidatus Acidiferrales bacterium]|jgi:hypothetical protein
MFPRLIALVCALAAVATTNALLSQTAAPASASSPSDPEEVRFTGEVVRGQPFERDIGHQMVFRLTPAVADEGGGWVIQILPPAEPNDEVIEFSEIATPPYHSYNERYLAAAFGYSAREAVQVTTRKFYFVRSITDEHLANEVVNAMLYPSTVTEAEKSRIAEESAAIQLGSGQLRIVHSRITPGKDGVPDTIAWVKFEATLNFSSGLTLQELLAPKPPSSRKER